MSRSITRINKTHSIEKVLNGEKKFYAEYNSKVVVVNDKPTRVPEFHITWRDGMRSLEDKRNNTPHFYYVAIGEHYESDVGEKYFLNKDKAEEYARQLYEENKSMIEDEELSYYLITRIIPFND